MGHKETDNSSQQKESAASSSKDTSFLYAWRHKSKKPDLEQGITDRGPDRANLGKNAEIKPSPHEQRRAEAKQMWKDKVKEGALDQNDQNDQNDQAIENEAKEIVNWLRKEVLSITSDTIANKVEKKVKYALEQGPATAKLLRDAIQLQSEYDGYSAPLKRWFGPTLSRTKQEVVIALKQESARYDRLSGEVEKNGGNKSIKSEMDTLAERIQEYNTYKNCVIDARVSALKKAEYYRDLLEKDTTLGPESKQLKLHRQLNELDAATTQQINGYKQAYRDNLLRQEVTMAQGHTTFGVKVGNVFHGAETVIALAAMGVSGLALRYAIEANSHHQ